MIDSQALPRLREWLTNSSLADGYRLPAERQLAEQLSVSRAEIRKALQVLELEGEIRREVGRGTFLSRGNGLPLRLDGSVLSGLAARTGPHQAMLARLAVEPETARLAALNATPTQLADLRRLSNEMRHAADWETYEDLDAAFHDLIAASTGNPLLQEVVGLVNGVRKAVVWSRLYLPQDRPTEGYHSFAEHDAIVSALERRDRAGARTAMKVHLESTLSTMMADD